MRVAGICLVVIFACCFVAARPQATERLRRAPFPAPLSPVWNLTDSLGNTFHYDLTALQLPERYRFRRPPDPEWSVCGREERK